MNWCGKTAIITGGAGFIGSQLTKRLVQLGATAIVIDNFHMGRKENLQNVGCEMIDLNVTLINKIKLGNVDPDFIFHLGAPSSDVLFRENPICCLTDTINGYIEVLKFTKKHQVRKLIYATSSSVYGKTPPPQSEDDPTQPTNLYGVAKLACENIAKLTPEVNSVGLRIFAGYGPGEEHKGKIASIITLFLYQILKGERPVMFGDGSQGRDFVYVDDIIRALISSAEKDVDGIINLGTGQSYSFIDVLNLLMKHLGKRITPIFSQKPEGYFDQTKAEISKMKRCLGITPLPLEKGIERYIEHIKNNSPHLF
jgi:UDP-glucose 4-epimerase